MFDYKKNVDAVEHVKVANGQFVEIDGWGSILFENTETGNLLQLNNVGYVPNVDSNLVSHKQIEERSTIMTLLGNGKAILFDGAGVEVVRAQWGPLGYVLPLEPIRPDSVEHVKKLARETGKDLYIIDSDPRGAHVIRNFIESIVDTSDLAERPHPLPSNGHSSLKLDDAEREEILKWHRRLGHLGITSLKKAADSSLGIPTKVTKPALLPTCAPCALGRRHRDSFGRTEKVASKPGVLIHCDLSGPFVVGVDGVMYFIVFVDDFSRWKWVYPIRTRRSEELLSVLQHWRAQFSAELPDFPIVHLHSDNEFNVPAINAWCRENNIHQSFTTPGTPQMNARAERVMRTLKEPAGAIMGAAAVPKTFWPYAVLTIAYIRNRIGHASLGNVSPFERLYKKKADVAHFRTFGCIAYPLIKRNVKQPSFVDKARPGVFVGYSVTSPGYVIYFPDTKTQTTSVEVVFDEASIYKWDTNEELHMRFEQQGADLWDDDLLRNQPRPSRPRPLEYGDEQPGDLARFPPALPPREIREGWHDSTPPPPPPPAAPSPSASQQPSPPPPSASPQQAGPSPSSKVPQPPAPPSPQAERPAPLPTIEEVDETDGTAESGTATPPVVTWPPVQPQTTPPTSTVDADTDDAPASPPPASGSADDTARVQGRRKPATVPRNVIPDVPEALVKELQAGSMGKTRARTGALRRDDDPQEGMRRASKLAQDALDKLFSGEDTTEAALPSEHPIDRAAQVLELFNTYEAGIQDEGWVKHKTYTARLERITDLSAANGAGQESSRQSQEFARLAQQRKPNPLCTVNGVTARLDDVLNGPDGPKWREAQEVEWAALKVRDALWPEKELPEGKNLVGHKWVFTNKYDLEGNIVRYKARLCAQGFDQIDGVDFDKDQISSPVARMDSLRSILAVAISQGYKWRLFDVVSAYLYGINKHEIYMVGPKGFHVNEPGETVYRLHRSLYGLKASGREWYDTLTERMEELGFLRTVYDPCVFMSSTSDVIVIVYVDDLFVLSRSPQLIEGTKKVLEKSFAITESPTTSSFLGLAIHELNDTKGTVQLHQKPFILNALKRYGFDSLNGVKVPMDTSKTLPDLDKNNYLYPLEDRYRYMSMIGTLSWLSNGTRPDIHQAVNRLARYCSNAAEEHFTAVKKVFRYLVKTIDLALTFEKKRDAKFPLELVTYADANFAESNDKRKSTTGIVVLIEGMCVSWTSKLQSLYASSTTEAEYIALSQAAKDVIGIGHLLRDVFGSSIVAPPYQVFCDNDNARGAADPVASSKKNRHLELTIHMVKDFVKHGVIKVIRTPSQENLADALTKSLNSDALGDFTEGINLLPIARSKATT